VKKECRGVGKPDPRENREKKREGLILFKVGPKKTMLQEIAKARWGSGEKKSLACERLRKKPQFEKKGEQSNSTKGGKKRKKKRSPRAPKNGLHPCQGKNN